MKKYTEEQMTLWGNLNMMVGVVALTAAHFIMLLLGAPPLNWMYQGFLLVIVVIVASFTHRQYRQTKEIE